RYPAAATPSPLVLNPTTPSAIYILSLHDALPSSPAPAAGAPASRTTPATAAPGVGFAVQVGAFSNAAEAERLRERLRGLGFTAFTDTVDTERGRLTRVKAGPVPAREDAERLKSQLRSRAGLDGLVRPHP